jgi:hypothetical protein
VHGINATSVTAHKPPFPNSRIMLLISISRSITKFPPEQRVVQNGMKQLHDRSSRSTSTASLSTSTSTKNIQNKTLHRIGRSAALNFRNFFGGGPVTAADSEVLGLASDGRHCFFNLFWAYIFLFAF